MTKTVDSYRFISGITKRMIESWIGMERLRDIPWTPLARPLNGYGLGLFGRVGPAAGILLTVVIYLIQIPISRWWMKRFRYGPAEWLWRSLTYLKPQPMRMQSPTRAT